MDEQARNDIDEESIGRLLRAAGPREQLPRELNQRWESHFRNELNAVRVGRARSRRRLLAGAAAGVIAIGITLSLLLQKPAGEAPVMRVTAVSGTVTRLVPGIQEQALVAAQPLAAGQSLHTASDGVAAVTWAGYDLRLNRDTRVTMREDGIALSRGEIYVSDAPRRIGRHTLTVTTPHGTIRDIGTQFRVQVRNEGTVTTVRQGIIELDTGSTSHRAEARPGSASRLSVDRDRQVRTASAAPSGSDWQWIYRADPGFALEGRTAFDFLQWSVGESGLELVFESAAAEAYAHTTTLHGSIEDLDPESAVAPVLATTDLDAAVDGGTLRVTLDR